MTGRRDQDENGQDQAIDDEEEVDQATEEQLAELRETTTETFKNLSWTRLVTVHDYAADTLKSWPIAPDLSDEYDHMFTIPEDDLPEFIPLFDHVKFSKTNPQPQMEAWKLNE